MSPEELRASEEKMRAAGVPEVAIATFRHYYLQLEAGEKGLVPESEIEPVESLPAAADLPEDQPGLRDALDATVVVKLNGGLGPSLGRSRPQSLGQGNGRRSFPRVLRPQRPGQRPRHRAAGPPA